MDQKTKFKLKAFIIYLIFQPWVDKFYFTNVNMILWTAIILSFIFKLFPLFIGAIILKIILHAYTEYKSGKYIYWLRMRDDKLRKWRETMVSIRKEKREKMLESELTINNSEQNKLDNPISQLPINKK